MNNRRLRDVNQIEHKNVMGTSVDIGDYRNDPRPLGLRTAWPQWTKNCCGACVPCTWRTGEPYTKCDGYANMMACKPMLPDSYAGNSGSGTGGGCSNSCRH